MSMYHRSIPKKRKLENAESELEVRQKKLDRLLADHKRREGEIKESFDEFKEEYNFEELLLKDELENDSSQGEEENQYESRYLAEISTLKEECEAETECQTYDWISTLWSGCGNEEEGEAICGVGIKKILRRFKLS